MIRRIVFCACAAASLLSPAVAQADPPQCGDGPIVMAGCQSPGSCTAVIDNRCVGPVVPPLLPDPGPVRVGLEGIVGVGS
ncbi:hypothetical protein AB4Z42_21285 [Mycobacterium sp. 2YAF39]|uniref:hypothetical protein n=1 Tax=Mycobacterium sp. 2YAF39 TaxID=3233033 RepID=UPI003F94FB26